MIKTQHLIYGIVLFYFLAVGTLIAAGIGSAFFLGVMIMFSGAGVFWILLKYKESKKINVDEAKQIIQERAFKLGWLNSSIAEQKEVWIYPIADDRKFSESGRLWWGLVELENGNFGSMLIDEKTGEVRGEEPKIDYIPSPVQLALRDIGRGGNIGYAKNPFTKRVVKVETSKKEETKAN